MSDTQKPGQSKLSTEPTPPWYQDGLRFGCTGCGNCCLIEGYVWVDRREVSRFAKHLDLDIDEFGRRFLRKVGRRYSLTEVSVHGDPAQKACVFWEGNCSVYDARPRQCRTFPFWSKNLETPEDWHEVAQLSPDVGNGRLYQLGEIESFVRGKGETSEQVPDARCKPATRTYK